MNRIKLGNIMRLLRLSKGYSQENLAELLGISQSNYGKLERGESRIALETVEKIADTYSIPLVDLLKLSDEQHIIQMHCNSTNGLNINSTINICEVKSEIEQIKTEIEKLKIILEQHITNK
jgi:transcriptional regulator with XRE-family HTH domain